MFEVGLSWSIVFGKRDAFRQAFQGFDVGKVAAMTERDVDRLVQDASIIRNRGKIQATVDNARAMLSASPSLAELAKSYELTRDQPPRSIADLPVDSAGGGVRAAAEVADTACVAPAACTRSCRTSAWLTITFTAASARSSLGECLEPLKSAGHVALELTHHDTDLLLLVRHPVDGE